jgi:ribosome-binding protein aMBF1 (putative translation factor)
MAARRIPLEKMPTKAEEAEVMRQQKALRNRVGAALKQARLDAGLSQRQLGLKANVSSNYLGQAELGRRAVSIDFLNRVAFFLKIPPASFLSE